MHRPNGGMVFLAAIAVISLHCSSAQGVHPASSGALVFASQYSSGGETPFGFRISVFEGGWIELQSPRGNTLRRKLSDSELSEAKAASSDADLVMALRNASESAERACCEPEEVLLEVGINREKYRVVLEGMEAPSEKVRALFEFVNGLGNRHFGSEFTLLVPTKK